MSRLLLALALACSVPLADAGTIYRYVDKDGNVTFTNMPMPGAKAFMTESAPTGKAPADSNTPRAPARPRQPAANVAVPSVDAGTQRNRDEGRRRILQSELDNEQKALQEARNALNEARGKPGTNAAQLQRLQDAVTDRERNIDALNRELGRQGAQK